MKFQLKEPLEFIRKKDLVSGFVEYHNGIYRLTSGEFRQNLSKREYTKLMAAIEAPADSAIVEQPIAEDEDQDTNSSDENDGQENSEDPGAKSETRRGTRRK